MEHEEEEAEESHDSKITPLADGSKYIYIYIYRIQRDGKIARRRRRKKEREKRGG